ncbi:MAG: efflux transporter outer membrane subunit [Planctomycetes bacterium]|nr:efflux transporter outer membrane subunit [Planctomycetota bacterium]
MNARAWSLLALGACAADPPPPVDVDLGIATPARWQSPTTDGELSDAWWQGFGDAALNEHIQHALAHNKDLVAAAMRLHSAAELAVIAGAGDELQADAGLTATRARRAFVGFPFGGGGVLSNTSTTLGLSLNLSWEIDLWGRVRAGERAALAEVQATAADLHAAELSVVAQTCKAWFAVIEARQQLALAQATVASFVRTADDVRDRYRRGVRPALDAHLVDTNVANARAAVPARQDQLQRAIRQFEILTGRYPGGTTASSDTLPTALPAVPAGLPGELLQRRPDLAAAERRLAAAGCRIDQARASLYPRLSLTASGGTTSEKLEDLVDDDFRVWSLGANLLQPLLAGGSLRAEVRRQEATFGEALARYGSAVLRAFGEVESALAAEGLLAERQVALTAAAQHAGAASALAHERYLRGLAEALAVADTQRQSFAAESARIAAQRQQLDLRIDLFLALGGGFRVQASESP